MPVIFGREIRLAEITEPEISDGTDCNKQADVWNNTERDTGWTKTTW